MTQLNQLTGKGWQLGSKLSGLLLVCLMVCLGSVPGLSQAITGSFSGQVLDQSGAIIPKANITLTNQDTREARKTISNDSGFFTFASVLPGTYSVGIEAKGFKTWKQNGLPLNAGDSRKVAGIAMEVGAVTESVTVQTESLEIATTDNGEHSSLLSENDIKRLSVQSRELSELIKMLPGVTVVNSSSTSNTNSGTFTDMGATGSAIGVGLSPNGAPYRGGTSYMLDGADIIDHGVNGWSIASVNPDMTSEVKIQTSNFGAEYANGPVVVNSLSKFGTANYHGQAYLYTRNGVLNSNYWENNHAGTKRTQDSYYYPGGNFGGPVRLPFTDFNKNNKLLCWGGYEYQWQNPGSSTILQSYIPGADMLKGNFSLDNTTETNSFATNAALCPSGFTSTTPGTWCSNPTVGGYDADGNAITNAASLTVDSNAQALAKLWPSANVDPSKNNGHNYYKNFGGQQNVYIYRFRVDYNLSENVKLFVGYQQGGNTAPIPAHMWWNPTNAVPYAGGGMTQNTVSRVLTMNLLTVISPSLTNEFIGAWGYVNSPLKPVNLNASLSSTIGYNYGTYFNASKVAPGVSSTLTGQSNASAQALPDTTMPDVFSLNGGQYATRKQTPSFSDNLTKVYKNHTFKFGVFTELASNDQGSYENPNGSFTIPETSQKDAFDDTKTIGSINPTANFVMGITGGFSQNSSTPRTNMAYRTTSAFAMDDWKVNNRLTINLGWRFDHLGRWYDRTSNGMAVWLPGLYTADVSSGTMPFPGVRWHGIDPGIPNSGSPTNIAFTSPRLGFAYDLNGHGSTVIRGGWGEYRWTDQYNDYGGPLTTAANMQSYNSPTGNFTMKELETAGTSYDGSVISYPTSGVTLADPEDREDAGTYAYNLTISHQMPHHTLLEVAYVGNQTKNLLMGGQSDGSGIGGSDFSNINKIALGGLLKANPVTGAAAPTDPESLSGQDYLDYFPYYKGYGSQSVIVKQHKGYSNYNGLQVAWAKQSGKLSYNLNYTWSKSLGIVGSTLDAFTVHGNYGILSIDRPHVINTSYTYSLGEVMHTGNVVVRGAVNGWNLSGTTSWQAGGNLQAQNGQNMGLSVYDSTLKENLSTKTYYGTNVGKILLTNTCNPKSGLGSHQYVNLQCFAPPTVGDYGKRQIGYIGGPSYFNSDLTIFKTFSVPGRGKVEFRASAFNWLNHPLRVFSSTTLLQPTFTTTDKINFTNTSSSKGGIADVKTGYRLGELSLKYTF